MTNSWGQFFQKLFKNNSNYYITAMFIQQVEQLFQTFIRHPKKKTVALLIEHFISIN